MAYSIKEVSKKMNLPTHTLRFYEKEGLLPFINRSKGGIRRFSDSDLDSLEMICCLKSTGMSVKQIKEFVELSKQGEETLKQRFDMLVVHKRNVEEQIALMEKHLKKVNWKIEFYSARYEDYKNKL